MIELPLDFVPDLITAANSQIANFSDLLILVMGIFLSIFAIGAFIGFIKK